MNNFAISSVGIGEALQRSASALAAANNGLNESIALAVGMNTVLQNPQQVGTALKTVSMYLRAAKTEAEEAGESTEGMASSVSKLRDELLLLTKNKVDIMVDDNTFKSTYQILKELSEVWESLEDIDTARILELIGGKRNAAAVTSLLTNFKDAEAALETAQNAAGSALRENEKYLDSIAGKTDILNAKFETFANSLVNSDIIKFFVDLASVVVTVADGAAKIHMLVPALTGILTLIKGLHNLTNVQSAVNVFAGSLDSIVQNGAVPQEMMKQLLSFNKYQKDAFFTALQASKAYQELNPKVQESVMTTLAFARASDDASNSVGKVGLSIKAAFMANPIMAVVTAITFAIGVFVTVKQHIEQVRQAAIDAAHDIAESWTNAQKSYDDNVKSLEGMRKEFDELAKGVDDEGNNVSLTADQYERYQSLVSQIIDISPQIVKAYDNQAKAVLNYKDALNGAIKAQEDQKNIALQEYLGGGDELFEGFKTEYKDLVTEIKKIGTDNKNGLFDVLGDSSGVWSTKTLSNFRKAIEKLGFDDGNRFQEILARERSKASRAASGRYKSTTAPSLRLSAAEGYAESDYAKAWLSDVSNVLKLYENIDVFSRELRASGAYQAEDLRNIQRTLLGVSSQYQKITELQAEGAKYLQEWVKWQANLDFKSGTDNAFNKLPLELQKEYLNSLKDIVNLEDDVEGNTQAAQKYAEELKTITDSPIYKQTREMAKGLEDGSVSVEEYLKQVERLRTFTSDKTMARNAVADWLAGLAEFANGLEEASGAAANYEKELLNLSDVIDNFDKHQKILSTAMEEMKDGGGLSAETIKSIMSAEGTENLLQYLREENGLIKLNTEAWEERTNSIFNGEIDKIQQEINSLIEQNKKLLESGDTEAYNANVAKIAEDRNLIQMYQAIADEIAKAEEAAVELVNALDFSDMISNLDSAGKAVSGITSAMETLNEGTALTKGELAKLALEYPKLLEAADLFTDGSVEGQRQMLNDLLAMYDEEYDATVDLEIKKLQAINEELNARVTAEQDKDKILTDIATEQVGNELKLRAFLVEKINEFNALEAENHVKSAEGELTVTEATMTDILEAQGNMVEDSAAIWQNQAATIADAFEEGGKGAITALDQTGEKIEKFAGNVAKTVKPMGQTIAAALSGDVNAIMGPEGTTYKKIGTTGINAGVEGSGKSLKDIIKENNAKRAAEAESGGLTINGLSIDEWVEQQKEIIAQRIDALKAQISANETAINNLRKLKDVDLSSIYGTKSKSDSSGKSDKEIEAYVADIDAYRDAVRRLEQVQQERAGIERKLAAENDLNGKIELERQLMKVYQEEIDAEADLMSQRQETIKSNAAALEELGFSVKYVAESNDFYVENMNHVNDLVADSAGGYDTVTEATNELRKSAEDLIKTTESLNDSNKESAESILNLGDSITTSQNNIYEHISQMAEQAKQSLSEVTSAYKTLSDAANEYGETGHISLDTFQSLVDLSPAYLTYLRDETGKITMNKDALQQLIAKKVENLAVSRAMQLVQTIHEYREDAAALQELASATDTATKSTWDLVYANLAAENLDSGLNTAFLTQIQALQELADATKEGINASLEGVVETTEGVLDAINEKAEAAKQALGDIAGAYRTLIDAVESYNENGYLSLDTFQSLMDLSPAYIAYLYDESGAINLNRGALESLIAAKVENLALSKAMALVDSVIAYQDDAAMLYSLANATNVATDATWGLVYAKLAEANISDDMKDTFTAQIDAIRNLATTAQAGISQSFTTVTRETQSATAATQDYASALEDANKEAEDAYKKQIEQQKKQIEKQKEILENEAKKKIDALKDQIDQFKKIVDLKKESLAASKKESDYEDDISERIEEIARLQARIDQLSLDDSRAAQAQRQALVDELNEKQKDLADTQGDHAYDAQIDALDKLADEYEDEKNAEIKKLEDNLEKQKAVYDRALENLENSTYSAYSHVTEMGAQTGRGIYSNITENWYKASQAVREYGATVAAVTGVQNAATNPLYNRLDAAELYRKLGGNASAAEFNKAFTSVTGTGSGLTKTQVGSMINGLNSASINAPSNVVYEPSISVSINTNGGLDSAKATSYGQQVANVAIKQIYDTLERKGASSNISGLKMALDK